MTAAPLRPARGSRSLRLAALVLSAGLLAAGCSGAEEEAPETAAPAPAASDDGGAPQEPSDGGASAAPVPAAEEPIAVTPAPADFSPPSGSCTGEGMHLVEPGKDARPALPERDGITLSIGLESMEKDTVELTATLGNGKPHPIEPAQVGDTFQIDLWTLSVTSICPKTDQVEFDVID